MVEAAGMYDGGDVFEFVNHEPALIPQKGENCLMYRKFSHVIYSYILNAGENFQLDEGSRKRA